MIFGRKRKKFEKAVDEEIIVALMTHLEREDAVEAYKAFRTTVQRSEQMNRMPSDLVEKFRKAGLSAHEAAMSHLDASVTEVKAWAVEVGMRPEIQKVVALIENCIDKMFLAQPTSIVPRNGSVGPELSEFTSDF